MILDPINSITSVSFYRKVARQSFGRSFLYLGYLSLIFAAATTAAMKLKVGPMIAETFRWIETSVPPLTFANGKLSAPISAPLAIRHPQISEISFVLDTPRTEPVTVDMMEANKAIAYVTSNALYLMPQKGKLETYDFSRAAGVKPVTINADFYRNAHQLLSRSLYPMGFVITVFLFLIWKLLASLIYSLLALILNAVAGAGLGFGALLNIAVYAQTLVILLQGMLLFSPVGIPLFPLIALALTGVYLWLAIKKNLEPEPAA